MNRGHFPSDEAVIKLLWLAICDTCGQTSPRTRQGERTATIQAQGQGQARRRTDHHRLEQSPGPAHHRLPQPNQPLPVKRLHRKLDRSDPPGVHVGHESHIDPPGEGAYIGGGTSRLRGNVGDPQPTRGKRLEVAPDQVGRALLSRRTARGVRGPGTADAAQAQVAHEPHGRCTGPRDRHRDAQRPQVGPASRASCGPPAPSSWFLWTLDISALRASSRRLLTLGGRLRRA